MQVDEVVLDKLSSKIILYLNFSTKVINFTPHGKLNKNCIL